MTRATNIDITVYWQIREFPFFNVIINAYPSYMRILRDGKVIAEFIAPYAYVITGHAEASSV